jgi:group II intron reverse transcriptase/maturase
VKIAENREGAGCTCEGRLEAESDRGAWSGISLEGMEKDGAGTLLGRVLERDNLNRAYKRVKKNRGAAGIDGMTTDKLLEYLKRNGDELIARIMSGKYKPQPVMRVETEKLDGGVRLLGVPTVVDRVIQLAIAQILEPIFEPGFSDDSYGFRPGRNAHQAVKRAVGYYDEGYRYVVDIDLAKYFDTINHDILINMLREEVQDESLLSLIRKCLKSGVMIDGVYSPTVKGSTQGSPLSPLLSNIYLTKFDRMLEERGHRFVRYADDCNIYVKSQRAGLRVMSSCAKYLEKELKLRVNQEKSTVGSPLELKFLGFSLYVTKSGSTRIQTHVKSLRRFKNKLKERTRRNRGTSIEAILKRLGSYVTGWLGYYAIADMSGVMVKMTKWVRRRIRMYIWKQWKRNSARFEELKKLGVSKGQAWQWANTRKGYWRIAGSWILSTTLTNERLANLGMVNISRKYDVLHSSY